MFCNTYRTIIIIEAVFIFIGSLTVGFNPYNLSSFTPIYPLNRPQWYLIKPFYIVLNEVYKKWVGGLFVSYPVEVVILS